MKLLLFTFSLMLFPKAIEAQEKLTLKQCLDIGIENNLKVYANGKEKETKIELEEGGSTELNVAATADNDSNLKYEWYYWNQQLESLLEWLPINYVKEERLS